MQFIDLQRQYELLKQEIDSAIHKVLDSGKYIMGPQVAELESELAKFVGVRHAIAVSSGTDSLLIALMALGVGPGDEVITTPFTWISTAEVIGLVGAKPVFVDIESSSYNLDPQLLENAITPRTKAIIPVGLFGQMANMERIGEIAARYALPVIEDGAQSFGATRHGRASCGVSKVGSTSFFPAKPLGCYGDGGALFTDDDELNATMRAIRTHGGESRHYHPYLGVNGRLDTIQAAVLLAKLPYYSDEVEARGRIGGRYSEMLEECCVTPKISEGNTHVYAQYTIRVEDRDAVGAHLQACGIPTAVYYPKCLHEQPVFASLGYEWGSFPVSEQVSRQVISLPMHPWLTETDQNRIVAAVKEAVAVAA